MPEIIYRKRVGKKGSHYHKRFLKRRAAYYSRLYYYRKKRKKLQGVCFPHLLPYWDGWTPPLVRLMMKYMGWGIADIEDIIWHQTFDMWEKGEIEVYPHFHQHLTTIAEEAGWWHYAPFPPKVVLVLARTAKDMVAFSNHYRFKLGEARWIPHPRYLKYYTYRQVRWIAVTNVKHLKGLHNHPVVQRFARRCSSIQKRPTVMWKPRIGEKRIVPNERG